MAETAVHFHEEKGGTLMFSDNHKISLRQMQALFCFYFLGTASLFLPAELAEGSGRACWLVMLMGGLLAAELCPVPYY